ncbi:MAG: M20 family metallopeptidase [Candidatus Bathyarchaeota archaeon]|jgi:acetylornithine deacetylase/succinyl-diaminopimelate desuccinylase family protein
MSLESKFFDSVDALSSELVELTREMVRTPSVNPPGDERAISGLVSERLKALGFKVELVESEPGRLNTLGRLQGGGAGRNFLFNGHYDTVPVGDPGFWSVDPFGGSVRDGRIYGRGSGDMKGAIASAIIAAKALDLAGIGLRGDFLIHGVADEEVFGRYGTRYLAEEGYVSGRDVDLAVVGEGSVRDGVIHARTSVRGRVLVNLLARGKSAHSSRPEAGVNAVLKMGKVLLAIDNYGFEFPPHHLLPAPTIAPGTVIKGGTKDNVIPELCEAVCDVRIVPGMTVEGVLGEVSSVVDGLREEDPELDVEVTSPLNKPPSEIPVSHELFKVADRAVRTVAGYGLKPVGTSGSNDTSWLTTITKIPSMAFGPGGGNAHGADEWASIGMLEDFAKIYGLMAMEICGVE